MFIVDVEGIPEKFFAGWTAFNDWFVGFKSTKSISIPNSEAISGRHYDDASVPTAVAFQQHCC